MKQVVIVHESLQSPRGQLAAQVARASVQGYAEAPCKARQAWLDAGMPKVVLHGDSPDALRALALQASRAGLPAALVEDAGPGAVTCLCIGPACGEAIDRFTREMAPLR